MAVRMEKMAQTSEHMGAAQIKAEADAAAAARLASAAKAASDARIADVEKSRDYYKARPRRPFVNCHRFHPCWLVAAATRGLMTALAFLDCARTSKLENNSCICINQHMTTMSVVVCRSSKDKSALANGPGAQTGAQRT